MLSVGDKNSIVWLDCASDSTLHFVRSGICFRRFLLNSTNFANELSVWTHKRFIRRSIWGKKCQIHHFPFRFVGNLDICNRIKKLELVDIGPCNRINVLESLVSKRLPMKFPSIDPNIRTQANTFYRLVPKCFCAARCVSFPLTAANT